MVERTLVWQQERAAKLDRTKQAVIEQELQECRFKPLTSDDFKRSALEQGATLPDETWYNMNGVQKHLERQFVGRQTRYEKEQNLALRKSPTSRWKNELTRPQEFHFELDDRKDPFLSPSREHKAPEEEPRALAYPIGTFGRTSGNFEPQRRVEEEEVQLQNEELGFDDALDILHNSLHDMTM